MNYGTVIEDVESSEDYFPDISRKIDEPETKNEKVELPLLEHKPVIKDGSIYIFQCPHCDNLTMVDRNDVNCSIFRHGYFINNGILSEQVNPHLPKEQCEELVKSGKVVGCCKPFQLERYRDTYIVKKCDYI